MTTCTKCGNEMLDEAIICPSCGTAVETQSAVETKGSTQKKNKKKPLKTIAIIVAAVVVALGIIALIFIPRPKNLTIDDFKEYKSYISVIAKFGLPTYADFEDEYLLWEDCGMNFYGIPIEGIEWDKGELIAIDGYRDGKSVCSKVLDHCDSYNAYGAEYKDMHWQILWNSNTAILIY